MVSGLLIRPSRDDDVAAITAIYGHHVLNGIASFEEAAPSEAEMARRRAELLARGFPYFVAEHAAEHANGGANGTRIAGYAYAGPYRARIGYRFSVEDSIYLDPGEVGRGIGRALLTAVIEGAAEQGYRQMVAVIGGSETLPSIRLHAALGFRHVGVLHAIGFKFGRWVDSVLMQRPLGPDQTALPG
jgi:phosphinothricin acetyltransferase